MANTINIDGFDFTAENIRVIHILEDVWMKSERNPDNHNPILTTIAYVVNNDDSCYQISPFGVEAILQFAKENNIKVTKSNFLEKR